ncbi:MAG: hypothetical protein KA004_18900 [Verrucomicrobiales bacterium]|nr:hypothetical protein [Verrucomicrobiales bacterium]
MKKRCKVCKATYEAPPTSKRVTCGAEKCRAEARIKAAKRKRWSSDVRKKISAGVRKGEQNKVPFATRWSVECEKIMRRHMDKTGESRVATLERLVRENLREEAGP